MAYTYAITATDVNAWDALTITAVTKPGWLALVDHHNRTAILGGTPTNANVGSHPVVLQVADSHGTTATQSFTITVANVNDPPNAQNDNAATDELTPVSVNVLSNDDNDPDGDSVFLVSVGTPNMGSVSINGSIVVYTPTNRNTDYNAVFTYTISDGALSDTGSVLVSVTAPDDPPFISNILNQHTNSGVPIGPLSFTVGDPDTPVGMLTLQKASSNIGLVPLPNITFGGSGANRTVTITPTAGTGAATITVTVRDGTSSRRDAFVLTVGALNSPPDFTSTPVTAATEDVAYTYSITVTDLDAGDALTISAVTKPAWLALIDYHNRTATLGGMPLNADVGDHAVTLRVVDDAGAANTQSFTLTVANVNDPPIISNILNQRTTIGVPVGPITFTVSDVDTSVDALTLDKASSNTALVMLSNITFGGSGANRTVTLTPTAGLSGAALITVTVSDGDRSALDVFVLTVGAGNSPPDFTSTPVTAATEDVAYTYAITTTDLDAGDTLTITALTKPAWLTLTDHHNRTATLGGTPTNADVGDHLVRLQVMDSAGTAESQVFTVTVSGAANQAPLADAGLDQAVTINTLVTLNGGGSSDPDGNLPLLYSWTQTGGSPPVVLSSATISQPTFTAPDSATVLTFTLIVTDSLGLGSTPDTVVVTVGGVLNQLPVANAGLDQAVTINTLVTLNGGGSSDPDGNLPLVYSWTQTGGSSPVVLSSATISQPTFTAPGSATVLTFTLVVTDSLGLGSAPDTVVVTVSGVPNQPPFADAGPNQAVNTRLPVTLNGSNSFDPDGHPLTYGWTQAGGLLVSLSSHSAISPTFIAPGSTTILTFTLIVTDSLGLASTPDTVVIAVTEYRIYLPLVKRN